MLLGVYEGLNASRGKWRQMLLRVYGGSNALLKCMEATMLFKNVWRQQCSSKMYVGTNVLQKCTRKSHIYVHSCKYKGFPKLKKKCMMAAMLFKNGRDKKLKRQKAEKTNKQHVWKSKVLSSVASCNSMWICFCTLPPCNVHLSLCVSRTNNVF